MKATARHVPLHSNSIVNSMCPAGVHGGWQQNEQRRMFKLAWDRRDFEDIKKLKIRRLEYLMMTQDIISSCLR